MIRLGRESKQVLRGSKSQSLPKQAKRGDGKVAILPALNKVLHENKMKLDYYLLEIV